MEVSFLTLRLKKLFPLAISRGTTAEHNNLFVFVRRGEHVGIGECAPRTGFADTMAPLAQADLERLVASDLEGLSIHGVHARAREMELDPFALCALDIALWDLRAKEANMPLYRLLGLSNRSTPTSVTIGIEPEEIVRERVPIILDLTGAKALKIKLGSPQGMEHDQQIYSTAAEVARPYGVSLRVDANGGWDVARARSTMAWLAERGCDYVEQPLEKGNEAELPAIFEGRPLPIYLDESIWSSADIPPVVHCIDGVNLKLTKCGGITEALRIVATARAHGLGTMIGCMSDSSVGIAAGAALGELFDHIDLDSHLNLNPDPATGAPIIDGVVTPTEQPGHGAALKPEFLPAP
ncbi:MAG: dipeptide epimerase [Chthonomonas sp.]|nr:dipeptide epimerase [Chthonomonas sp.]